MPTFTPPTVFDVSPVYKAPDRQYPRERLAERLFRHYGPRERGRSVLKINGVYVTVDYPTQDRIDSATEVYLGGHVYTVSDATATSLQAAGHTTEATPEAPTPEAPTPPPPDLTTLTSTHLRTTLVAGVLGQQGSRLYGIILANGHWGYSDDHGATWSDAIASWVTHPGDSAGNIVDVYTDASHMYAVKSNGKIFRNTLDTFTDWTDVSVPTRPPGTTGRPSVLTGNGTYLFYGNYNNSSGEGAYIWRSADLGASWTKAMEAPAARHVHAIRVDPTNPMHVFATVGDGIAVAGTGLYYSGDSGATWTQVSSNRYGIDMAFPAEASGVPHRILIEGDGPAEPHIFSIDADLAAGIVGTPTEGLIYPDLTPETGASWAGSARGIKVTDVNGHLVYWTTGESGAIGTRYGIWAASGPWYSTAVLLEELVSAPVFTARTFESGGYLINYTSRFPVPTFG